MSSRRTIQTSTEFDFSGLANYRPKHPKGCPPVKRVLMRSDKQGGEVMERGSFIEALAIARDHFDYEGDHDKAQAIREHIELLKEEGGE
jgi:hypothetical protein